MHCVSYRWTYIFSMGHFWHPLFAESHLGLSSIHVNWHLLNYLQNLSELAECMQHNVASPNRNGCPILYLGYRCAMRNANNVIFSLKLNLYKILKYHEIKTTNTVNFVMYRILESGGQWRAHGARVNDGCPGVTSHSHRSKKVKFSHTHYWALGPELIVVYRQSARMRLFKVIPDSRLLLPSAGLAPLPRKRSQDVATTDWSGGMALHIYRHQELSWLSWLSSSGQFTHISGHPSAKGRACDRESLPAKDRRSCHCAMPSTFPARSRVRIRGQWLSEAEKCKF